jgi:uncharacterized protein YbjT (DUF2867 family)
MRIVVVGGTGLVGTPLVQLLRARGHDAVAASPRTGVDARSGSGLAEALAGADVVVDTTNAPDLAEADAFFRAAAGHIAAAAARAGVGRSVLLSVVGVDRAGANPYFAAKLAQEETARAGSVPTTVLRSTQFFEFAAGVLAQLGGGDRVGVAPVAVQPVAVEDVVGALADLATGPFRDRVEIGGPERLGADVWLRRVLTSAGDARQVVTDPEVDPFGTAGVPGVLVPAAGDALTGRSTLATWLAGRAL